MKKAIYLVVLFSICFSCKIERKEYYKSGTLKKDYTSFLGKLDGTYKQYYKSGNLQAVYLFSKGKKVDSAIYYNDSKQRSVHEIIHYLDTSDSLQYNFVYNDSQELIAEGKTIKEKDRIGKWKFYKKNYDSIVEYKYINTKYVGDEYVNTNTYVNQKWTISKSGDTLPFKSNYFSFSNKGKKDTVKLGDVLTINMMLIEPHFSYDTDIEVLIPFDDKKLKEDYSNFYEIKLDTFKSLKNDGIPHVGIPKEIPVNQIAVFGLRYEKSGKKRIRGVLIEYYKENPTDTKRIERRLFFDKTIFVEPR